MHTKIAFTISFVFLLLLSACRKDEIIVDSETIGPPTITVNHVNAGIAGIVTDPSGDIIADAEVRWGQTSTQTDDNGIFILSGLVKEQNAVLRIKKEGFFQAFQTLQVFADETVRTKVQMTPRIKTADFPSSQGGEFETAAGGKISFAANGFKDSNGNPYDGNVNLFAHYLDPTIPNLQAIMPGNLMAVNSEDVPQLLQSFGMMNVELEDDSGNPIQISQPATLTTPVPSTLQGQAPQTIPLWYFDTDDGLWKEEGSATLQGSAYVGEVNHFTWWNCDIPSDFISLKGSVRARNNAPVFSVRITIIEDGIIGVTNISDDGKFGGLVPINKLLLLEILNPCGEAVYTEEIGPFAVDTELPAIVLNDDGGVSWHSLEGTVLNCNDNPVSFGYLIVRSLDGELNDFLVADESGYFHGVYPDCGSTVISYYAVDPVNTMISETQSVVFDEDIVTGNIVACFEDIEGEMILNINGTNEIWKPCIVEQTPGGSGSFSHIESTILVAHIQEEGIVYYEFRFKSWVDQPTTWWSANLIDVPDIQGAPEDVYEFVLNAPGDAIILENNGVPGTIYHMTMNATVRDYYSKDVINDDVDMDVKAVIQ